MGNINNQSNLQYEVIKIPSNFDSHIQKISSYRHSTVYRHKFTKEEYEQYNIVSKDHRSYQQQLRIYEFRKQQNLCLVKVKYIQKNLQLYFCAGEYQLKVYTEHIEIILKDIQNIPFNNGLYLIDASLIGFKVIFDKYGYINIHDSLIGVNTFGKCKVWLNSNFALNSPEIEFSLAQDDMNKKQILMVQKIFKVIESHMARSDLLNKFKIIKQGLGNINFERARAMISDFCLKNRMIISNKFQFQNSKKKPEKIYSAKQFSNNSSSQPVLKSTMINENNYFFKTPTKEKPWQENVKKISNSQLASKKIIFNIQRNQKINPVSDYKIISEKYLLPLNFKKKQQFKTYSQIFQPKPNIKLDERPYSINNHAHLIISNKNTTPQKQLIQKNINQNTKVRIQEIKPHQKNQNLRAFNNIPEFKPIIQIDQKRDNYLYQYKKSMNVAAQLNKLSNHKRSFSIANPVSLSENLFGSNQFAKQQKLNRDDMIIQYNDVKSLTQSCLMDMENRVLQRNRLKKDNENHQNKNIYIYNYQNQTVHETNEQYQSKKSQISHYRGLDDTYLNSEQNNQKLLAVNSQQLYNQQKQKQKKKFHLVTKLSTESLLQNQESHQFQKIPLDLDQNHQQFNFFKQNLLDYQKYKELKKDRNGDLKQSITFQQLGNFNATPRIQDKTFLPKLQKFTKTREVSVSMIPNDATNHLSYESENKLDKSKQFIGLSNNNRINQIIIN